LYQQWTNYALDARQAHNSAATTQGLTSEVIAKRTKRHLDELEVKHPGISAWRKVLHPLRLKRSNYAETNLLAGEDDDEGGTKSGKGRARQTISDKRNLNILGSSAAAKKKKSTMSVRTALLYRKNLATLIEESVRIIHNFSLWQFAESSGLEHRVFTAIYSYVLDCYHASVRVPLANVMFCMWILGGV
jgi:hypothetical protein